jgi:ferredoxin-NADP reductase
MRLLVDYKGEASPSLHAAAWLAILTTGFENKLHFFPRRTAMSQELMNARLERKECISEVAQCYHFEFVLEGRESFNFAPGQFVSGVAVDANGKQHTRAYSLASAPRENHFELCVNRIQDGFFSNHLADLPDLPIGATIQIHGPHGNFILHEPLTDSILVATGTGVAPMRSFLQWLFPEDGSDRSDGKQIWLVYGAHYESELYYRAEFETLEARRPNFHYLPTLSRAPKNWTGLSGHVDEHVARIVEERATRLGLSLPMPPRDPGLLASELNFDVYAYLCGLTAMVSGVRERLKGFGWHRKQIVSERYD